VAIQEAILSATTINNNSIIRDNYNFAIFFVSSVYESTFSYDIIYQELTSKLPNLDYIIGCTTGGVIGTLDQKTGEPIEIEARASISLMVASLDTTDIELSLFHKSSKEIKSYLKNNNSVYNNNNNDNENSNYNNGVAFVLSADNSKADIIKYITKKKLSQNIDCFGGFASTVTNLNHPKIFFYDKKSSNKNDNDNTNSEEIINKNGFTKFTNGIVGILMQGNILVQNFKSVSCLPVGPIYEVIKAKNNEIFLIKVFIMTSYNKNKTK
jgi:small ligand-binding sensory domain FIST